MSRKSAEWMSIILQTRRTPKSFHRLRSRGKFSHTDDGESSGKYKRYIPFSSFRPQRRLSQKEISWISQRKVAKNNWLGSTRSIYHAALGKRGALVNFPREIPSTGMGSRICTWTETVNASDTRTWMERWKTKTETRMPSLDLEECGPWRVVGTKTDPVGVTLASVTPTLTGDDSITSLQEKLAALRKVFLSSLIYISWKKNLIIDFIVKKWNGLELLRSDETEICLTGFISLFVFLDSRVPYINALFILNVCIPAPFPRNQMHMVFDFRSTNAPRKCGYTKIEKHDDLPLVFVIHPRRSWLPFQSLQQSTISAAAYKMVS